MQLLGLPEEILVLILESTIRPVDPRVSLPNSQSILTCRTFHRIGLPILYRTLLLKSSSNAALVRRSLLERPALVRYVRHLFSRVSTFWLQLVLRAIGHAEGSLHTLDFSISAIWVSGRLDSNDEVEPLAAVPVRRLAVRLGSSWVMHDRVLSIVNSLAEAIERWPNLEVADIEPRLLLSSIPRGQPSPVALALSRSPTLRFLRTSLPPEWDPSLLITSENPGLKRIALTTSRVASGSDGISSNVVEVPVAALVAQTDFHPWLVEAQKHHRLMELIFTT
ncbi:hypothetical protein DFH94DRAFT_690018 [Russula ochroleuca]|uniref:Uncharacterized protein n=1 Tax=Russula ochroleuca TaxID=152965 RepID=A0A9P5TBZ0_9AGAM|nr:hypothetical protein DFH94DRAFT_690018 [Russula ochroleuca]